MARSERLILFIFIIKSDHIFSAYNFQWLLMTCGLKSKVFTMFYQDIYHLLPVFFFSDLDSYQLFSFAYCIPATFAIYLLLNSTLEPLSLLSIHLGCSYYKSSHRWPLIISSQFKLNCSVISSLIPPKLAYHYLKLLMCLLYDHPQYWDM